MRYLVFLLVFLAVGTCVRAQNWKSAAEESIRERRTSAVTVEVIDPNDQPVPGATIRLRMRQSAFNWGSIVQMPSVRDAMAEGFGIGSNHPYWNHLRNFNSLGAGNAGKWKQWLNLPNRETYLDIMDWMSENNIRNRLHAPIWPSIRRWNAVPDTVLNAEASPTQSKNEVIRDIVRGHLTEYMRIIDGKDAFEVDLVNELVHVPDITRDLMGLTDVNDRIDEHTQWYKWAHDAAPEVGLIANEYDLYQSGNDFHTRFVDYVQKMIERGAPIDGVGMQGHFFGPVPEYAELKRRLSEVAILGLPMAVTEFDMVTNTYAEMERVLYSVYSESLANNFTVWGAWDGNQWRGNAAIYNLDWTLKPSGRAWFDLVKDRWFTDTLTVAGGGAQVLRGHHGAYDLYVEVGDRVYQQRFTLSRDTSLRIRVGVGGYALPEATLELVNSSGTIYPNQPFQLGVASQSEIAEVTFYDGDQIIGFDDSPPFMLDLSIETPGRTLKPAAEVTYTSGYRERLTAADITIDATNRSPDILDVFPASGTTVLARDLLTVRVEGSDPDGDVLRARLISDGDTLIGSGTSGEFLFELFDLNPGSRRFRLVIDDGKFATDERQILYTVVTPGQGVIATSFPSVQNDDVEERVDGGMDLTGDLDLGEKIVGIRFPAAGIPAGAQVDSAFVQFVSEKPDQAGPVSIPITGELAVNPAPFRGGSNNLSGRSRTANSVDWTNIPDWNVLDASNLIHRTPDIGAIISQITGQDGWTTAGPLHLFFGLGTGGSKRSAYAVDQSEANRPVLTVHFTASVDDTPPLAPVDLEAVAATGLATSVNWTDPNPVNTSSGYELELDGILLPAIVREPDFLFDQLIPGTYNLRVRVIGLLHKVSDWSQPLSFELGTGTDVCSEDGTPIAIEDGLVVEDLGKNYVPRPGSVPAYLRFQNSNLGGTTSVRRNDSTTLRWKTEGYYQRNRELGQVFNVPEGEELTIDGIVLRTGNSRSAVLENTPGAPVYLQLYEVTGTPVINNNGTPVGSEATHGFTTNHRADDYLDGITYVPIAIVRGGTFPTIAPTTQNGGQEGHLRYLRWDLQNEAELTLQGGRRYAFTVGFSERGAFYGFSLGNDNQAGNPAAPRLRQDANGQTWWSMRREGDGTLPPTQVPGDEPPLDDSLRNSLIGESLYPENFECSIMPTTDGFPDVDTYRTLEFYIETVSDCPPAGQVCDDGIPLTVDDRTDGNCGCRGVVDDGCRPNGFINYARYEGISGMEVTDLRSDGNFPESPDVTDSLTLFEIPSNVGDDYGARMYGYLCPPASGVYTFWVAGDDHVELWLSTDENPENARRIAYHDGFTDPRQWDKYPTQESDRLFLEVATPYYIEAIVKEAGGGDHLSVGWQLPDGRMQRPILGGSISTITGDVLSSVGNPDRVYGMAAFPNPTRGNLLVTFDHNAAASPEAKLHFTTSDGRRLFERPASLRRGENRISTWLPESLPDGVYTVGIDSPSRLYRARIVVQR